jgi:hypothetical protein
VAPSQFERDPGTERDAEHVHAAEPHPVEVGFQDVGDGRDGGATPQRR